MLSVWKTNGTSAMTMVQFAYIYMWALKTIVEEDLQYLQEFLLGAYEPHGFVTELNQDDGVEDGLEDGPDGGPQNGKNDGG
jgi:hypothetical protein